MEAVGKVKVWLIGFLEGWLFPMHFTTYEERLLVVRSLIHGKCGLYKTSKDFSNTKQHSCMGAMGKEVLWFFKLWLFLIHIITNGVRLLVVEVLFMLYLACTRCSIRVQRYFNEL